jgi:hypothetical protein
MSLPSLFGGRPAQFTTSACPLRSSAMKSFPVRESGT